MDDLISRESALLCLTGVFPTDGKCDISKVVSKFSKRIKNLPSAEPQERTGKWIDMGDFEQCSVCTGTRLKAVQTYYGKAIWIRTPYCPNCGARMEGTNE